MIRTKLAFEEMQEKEVVIENSELDNHILEIENDVLEDDNIHNQMDENSQITSTVENINDELIKSKELNQDLSDSGLNVIRSSLEHFNIRRGYSKTKGLGFESVANKTNIDIALETVGGQLLNVAGVYSSFDLWISEVIAKFLSRNEKTRELLNTSVKQAIGNFTEKTPAKDLEKVKFGNNIVVSKSSIHSPAEVISNLKNFSSIFNNSKNISIVNKLAEHVESITALMRSNNFIGNKDSIEKIQELIKESNKLIADLNTDISINKLTSVKININEDHETKISIKTSKSKSLESFKSLSTKEAKELANLCLDLTDDVELNKALENLYSKIKTFYGYTSGHKFIRAMGILAKDLRTSMRGILNIMQIRFYFTQITNERNKIVNDSVKYINHSSN